ncbi:MAG: hypothetical protein JSS09_04525 [Verrucomicrobia bacterium]|nr:hypothetical protein [Verrucomicrobiota bacterium]
MSIASFLTGCAGLVIGYKNSEETIEKKSLRDASRPLYKTWALGEDVGTIFRGGLIGVGTFAATVCLNKAIGSGGVTPDVRIYTAGFLGFAMGGVLFQRAIESKAS